MESKTVKRPFLCLAVLLGCATLSCHRTLADAEIQKDDKPSYAERIIAIDKRDPEPIRTDFLIGDEVLVELAGEGAQHIDDCIEFLAAENHTWWQRQVAILSMYKLSRPDYVTFLRKMMDLLDRHRITIIEFDDALMSSYERSTLLIENFREDDVRRVLTDIAARPDIAPHIKLAIEHMLSGKALEDMRSFRRECCSSPAEDLANGKSPLP